LSHQTYPQTYISEKVQFKNFTREQGLSNGFVQTILQDGKEFLWFGTVDGLNRYDGRKFEVFKHLPADPYSLGSNIVLGLYEDKNGVLWIGTEGSGLNRYNREQENFTRYIINQEDSSGVANTVMTIYEDSYGVLWIGSLTSGLYTFDRKTELFTRYKNIPEDATSISDNRVWPIYEDSKGNIWIGTLYGGLNKFDRKEKNFIVGMLATY
jgi:ligand-binding sensor domain-containing protein